MKSDVASAEDAASPESLEPHRWLEDHGSALYRFALSKVRRADVAEDLVQETLLAAWRGHERFTKRSKVRTWLTAILKHKIIDWLRSSIREQKRVTLSDDKWLNEQFTSLGKWRQSPEEWDADAPDTELNREEFWKVMQACLNTLPTRMRRVFVLWQLDEQTGEEVCQELGISTSNLWVILHRSRSRLWRCLTVNWYGNPEPESERS